MLSGDSLDMLQCVHESMCHDIDFGRFWSPGKLQIPPKNGQKWSKMGQNGLKSRLLAPRGKIDRVNVRTKVGNASLEYVGHL